MLFYPESLAGMAKARSHQCPWLFFTPSSQGVMLWGRRSPKATAETEVKTKMSKDEK